jgi:hypothetical protein
MYTLILWSCLRVLGIRFAYLVSCLFSPIRLRRRLTSFKVAAAYPFSDPVFYRVLDTFSIVIVYILLAGEMSILLLGVTRGDFVVIVSDPTALDAHSSHLTSLSSSAKEPMSS